jgi:hypothetical protein
MNGNKDDRIVDIDNFNPNDYVYENRKSILFHVYNDKKVFFPSKLPTILL